MATPNDLASVVVQSLVGNKLNEALGSTEDMKNTQHQSMLDALTAVREQELHTLQLSQEEHKVQSLALKNEQAQLNIELSKSKAVAQGLATPQEPVKPVTPQQPANGATITNELIAPDTNFGKSLIDAITAKQQEVRDKGQRLDPVSTKIDDWLREQIVNQVSQLDNEKDLARSPFGQLGGLLGGILDIVSGSADIGTAIFGGKLAPSAKLELLTRAMSVTSPLLRAQMNDLLGRDRMEMSASQLLSRSGMPGMASFVNNREDANAVIAMGIDMRQVLADTQHTDFGANATTGIGDAFNAYENVYALLGQLREASTPEEIEAVQKQMVTAHQVMRAHMQRYTEAGGTPENFQAAIAAAQDTINKRFQKPLVNIPGDAKANEMQALQKATALEFTNKLHDFALANLEGIPLDVENLKKKSMGNTAYEIQQTYGDIGIYNEKDVKYNVGKYDTKTAIVGKGKFDNNRLPELRGLVETAFNGSKESRQKQSELVRWLDNKFMSSEAFSQLKRYLVSDNPNLSEKARNDARRFLNDYAVERGAENWLTK